MSTEVCPICGSSRVSHVIKNQLFTTRSGKKIRISNCEIVMCHACNEGIFTDENSERIEQTLSQEV